MRGKMSRFVLVFAVAMLLVGSLAQSASAYHPVGWFLGITRGPVVCGSPCDGGWYVGLRPGPVRRFLFGPYRYYPGYNNYGWSTQAACCNVCSTDPCCCTSVAQTTTTTIQTQPAKTIETKNPTPALKKVETTPAPVNTTPIDPAPTPVTPDPINVQEGGTDFNPTGVYPPVSSVSPLNSSATITLNVPADAKVFINDYETSSTGAARQFVSHNLMAGYDYEYKIRVEIIRQGQILEANRNVVLQSGQTFNVALRHDEPSFEGLAVAE